MKCLSFAYILYRHGIHLNSMQTSNQTKIQNIQEEKKRLRDRIDRLEGSQQDISQSSASAKAQVYEDNMAKLMQRKKKLEEERERQHMMKKMQQEYMERRNHAERQKRLQEIRNEKRMIQLEVGMKRMVFQGVKEKVKGQNSEQLMMRAMLRQGHQPPRAKPYSSKGNVRRDFEQFLDVKQKREYKEKWDVYELNEKRFEIFEKKQEALMREIVLNELIARGQDEEINVIKMNKEQLEDKMEEFGLSIEDYVNSIKKEEILEAYPEIQKKTKQRLNKFNAQQEQQEKEKQAIQRYKSKLKQELLLKPSDTVKMARFMVYDIINALVFDYEKRLNRFEISDFAKLKEDVDEKYTQVLLKSEDYEFSKFITLKLLEKVHEEFILEAAEEVHRLHQFSHMKTEECFEWMFAKGTNISKKLKDIDQIDLSLEFQDDNLDDEVNRKKPKNQLKKDQYLNKFQDYQSNIFDVDKLTTELINEINLLEEESKYFSRISTKVHGQRAAPSQPYRITYDRQLYVITNQAVSNAKKLKNNLQKLGISSKLELLNCKKFHNFWLIHDNEKVSLYSPWGLEVLPNDIGERISSLCGKIACAEIFPIYTFSGFPSSIMLGFQKGQLLKYNMNLDRIQNSQTNHAIYFPVLPQIKNGDEPPFPLQKKNLIKVSSKPFNDKVEIHEFRQFFQHHTTTVVSIVFYRHNSFISIDKNMKCAIWYYDYKEGLKCYKPAYTFEFVSSNHVYKQSENPRFKNIYPGDKLNESPQVLYKKWMQTEGFLKKQIYNNPKKKTATYRASDESDTINEIPVWKLNYDQDEKKVLKIYESYYTTMQARLEAIRGKMWKQYLMILCEREHVIRDDLKTLKIYGWDVQERKMRSIGVQLDVYKNQKKAEFEILDNMLVGIKLQLMAVISSGRILIFSLISGQLLRNISDNEFLQNSKYSSVYFTDMTARRSLLAAATKNFTVEISLNDHNTSVQQQYLNEMIQEALRKYINLI